MKDLFIIWLTVQLILIGFSSSILKWELEYGTYDCKKPPKVVEVKMTKMVHITLGTLFPLLAFVPEENLAGAAAKYCQNHPPKSKMSMEMEYTNK